MRHMQMLKVFLSISVEMLKGISVTRRTLLIKENVITQRKQSGGICKMRRC